MHRDTESARAHHWLTASLVLVGGALVLWRFTVGVGSWGDEPYAISTALRYALGDRPLVDSWDTNFSSAILALPFVKAWLAVAGSADGIMLGYRALQLTITSLTAFVAYRALRVASTPTSAWIIASLILVYMPFLSPIVGYGMDSHWHMLAGFLALLQYRIPPKRAWYAVLPGVASMLGAISNPPTVIVVPFFLAALVLAHRAAGRHRLLPAALYLAGAGLAGLAFLAILRFLAGPGMLSMLSYITHPDDHDLSAQGYLARLTASTSILIMPLVLGAALGGAFRLRRSRDPITIAAVAIMVAIAATYSLLVAGRLIISAVPQSLTYAAGMTALVTIVIAGIRLERGAVLLALTATGAGLGWFLGSNAGVHTAMLATPMAVAACVCTSAPSTGPAGVRPARLRAYALAALAVAVAIPGMWFTPEGATSSMTTMVRHGPYAGMLGTPDEAAQQREMVAALRALPDTTGRVLFLERFPLGYLITLDRPGTYSTWATSASGDRLQEYVDHTGDVPARIVLTRYTFDMRDDDFPADVNLDDFGSEYVRVYEGDDFVVYDRSDGK